MFRLILVPVFAVVFFQPAPNAHLWAALIYLVAFLTDIADGWIARHFIPTAENIRTRKGPPDPEFIWTGRLQAGKLRTTHPAIYNI